MTGPKGDVTREQIYQALAEKLAAVTGITTVTRKPVSIDQIGEMQTPCMWIEQVPQIYESPMPQAPTQVKLRVDVSIALSQSGIVQPLGAETYIPAADMNNLLDALDAALAADWTPANLLTLGGLVYWCRIVGQVITDDRTFNGKLLIIVPFEILVTT